MGDNDWVRYCDEDFGKECVEAHKINGDPCLESHQKSNYLYCPTSGHNLQMDNPRGIAYLIINELLGYDLPIKKSWEY